MGRATQGVKLINLKNNDRIAAVEFVAKSVDEDELSETNGDSTEIIDTDVEENTDSNDQ
jgi:DNA gyrase subunit A